MTNALTIIDPGARRFFLAEVCELTGLHREFVLEIVSARLVRAVDPDEPAFDESGLCRLRQIAEMRHHQQLNLRTVRLIVQLLDRLERAEAELRVLRERFSPSSD